MTEKNKLPWELFDDAGPQWSGLVYDKDRDLLNATSAPIMSEEERQNVLAIVRKQMDEGLQNCRRTIAEATYRYEPTMFQAVAYPKPSWFRSRMYRVRWYFSNLWQALRGIDRDEEEGDE